MDISELEDGQWFIRHNEPMMKTSPFLRSRTWYQAVSLITGEPTIPCRSSTADHADYGKAQVQPIEKPDWVKMGVAIPASG